MVKPARVAGERTGIRESIKAKRPLVLKTNGRFVLATAYCPPWGRTGAQAAFR
jgi:hypothetical protein